MTLPSQLPSTLSQERSGSATGGGPGPFSASRQMLTDRGCEANRDIAEEFIDPIRDPHWDRLVASHADATVFHHSAWAKVLASTYGHRPLYTHIKDRDGRFALIPLMEVKSVITGKRGVCLPFSDFCSPLLFGGIEPMVVTARILRLAAEKGWKHVELRGASPAIPVTAQPAAKYFAHTVDLRPGVNALYESFKSSVRGAIRKGEQSHLDVEVTRSREAMLEFFALHNQTRRRHGLPPQPLRFFLNIHREIIQPDMGFIVRVTKEGKPLASQVFFKSGGRAIYKFSASDKAQQDSRANNVALWSAIQFLCQEGAESLQLGKTSASEEGTRRFKLGWNAREEALEYYRYELPSGTWGTLPDRISGRHNSIFGRLPLFLNRLAGSILYPHLD